ncbi:MAG: hypothetical protein P8Y58_15540, partial [Novosphingobium sp.]
WTMTGVPAAPVDMVMPATIQTIIIGVALALNGLWVIWSLYRLIRHRDILPFTLLAGGLLTYVAVEPFYDVLGFVYHPEKGQVVAFNTLGRNFPLHLLLLYMVYWAFLAQYFMNKFEAGVSERWIWWAFCLWTPGEILFETPLLMTGLWSYYGDPPFKIGYYPLWLAPATAGSAILAFSVLHWARKVIGRGWTPILSLVMGSSLAAGCLGTSWPVFIALNVDRRLSPSGYALTVPASILTICLSAGCVWLALQLLRGVNNMEAKRTTDG